MGHLESRTISARWKGVYDLTEIWKDYGEKQRSFTSRSSSSSRPGLERAVSQAYPPESTADGPDDDAASVLSRSSSGGELIRGNTQVSSKHRSHGAPGPKSPARRPTQRSTPARSQAGFLAGKYGARAVSQVIPSGSNSADGLSPHWAILPWERYRRIDPLGLNQNARWKDPLLATPVITPGKRRKDGFSSHRTTDQCTVNMPWSHRDPVPGTGTRYGYPVPGPGTRCSVPPTTPSNRVQ